LAIGEMLLGMFQRHQQRTALKSWVFVMLLCCLVLARCTRVLTPFVSRVQALMEDLALVPGDAGKNFVSPILHPNTAKSEKAASRTKISSMYAQGDKKDAHAGHLSVVV
jgi:hypothetical protein